MPEMEEKGNPDITADRELINSVLQEQLGPILDAITQRFEYMDNGLDSLWELVMHFTEGLVGAADNHKRTSLSDELMSKYGKDMEPFDGFYKDVHGKGFGESLVEELMGEGAPDETSRDEWIRKKLDEAKGKYGKYVGIKAEIAPEAPAEEPAKESMAEEAAEPPEEQAAEEESGEETEGEPDAIAGLMNQMKTLGGEKHSLSKPNKK